MTSPETLHCSLAIQATAGATSSGFMYSSTEAGMRSSVMRVRALGEMALVRMLYLAPSWRRQLISPSTPIFAAP